MKLPKSLSIIFKAVITQSKVIYFTISDLVEKQVTIIIWRTVSMATSLTLLNIRRKHLNQGRNLFSFNLIFKESDSSETVE